MTQTISKKRVESIIIPPGNLYQEKRIAVNYAPTLMCTTCEEEIMQRVPGTRVYICEQCGAVEYR
jgi:ribosomal protein L37AE/L43A